MSRCSKQPLLDDLVSTAEQHCGHFEAEHFRGLQIKFAAARAEAEGHDFTPLDVRGADQRV